MINIQMSKTGNSVALIKENTELSKRVSEILEKIKSDTDLNLKGSSSRSKTIITSLNMRMVEEYAAPQTWKNIEIVGKAIEDQEKQLQKAKEIRDKDINNFSDGVEIDDKMFNFDAYMVKQTEWTELISSMENNLSKKIKDFNELLKTVGFADSSEAKSINIFNSNTPLPPSPEEDKDIVMVDSPKKDDSYGGITDIDFADI